MKTSKKAIVQSSKMEINYKACREKAKETGKVFVLKNDRPDAVLYSAAEYERISKFVEYFDRLENDEIALAIELFLKNSSKFLYSIAYISENINTKVSYQ